ncbi:hypothetical protein M885DRAFT_507710 [Pelagophyceae sp. CCMP2097]|nr:hypothetical protein M885DRAFT_507710 [Pelagophyceae sp. CCMP2097]
MRALAPISRHAHDEAPRGVRACRRGDALGGAGRRGRGRMRGLKQSCLDLSAFGQLCEVAIESRPEKRLAAPKPGSAGRLRGWRPSQRGSQWPLRRRGTFGGSGLQQPHSNLKVRQLQKRKLKEQSRRAERRRVARDRPNNARDRRESVSAVRSEGFQHRNSHSPR